MTTVLDANVHNIAVEGTFDDCQVRGIQVTNMCNVLTRAGHRQGAFRRPRDQQHSPPRRCQQHQLGTYPCSDHILLPLLLLHRTPDWFIRPEGPLCGSYR
jgi:hypothetical protein